jgi:hypothetical protein
MASGGQLAVVPPYLLWQSLRFMWVRSVLGSADSKDQPDAVRLAVLHISPPPGLSLKVFKRKDLSPDLGVRFQVLGIRYQVSGLKTRRPGFCTGPSGVYSSILRNGLKLMGMFFRACKYCCWLGWGDFRRFGGLDKQKYGESGCARM